MAIAYKPELAGDLGDRLQSQNVPGTSGACSSDELARDFGDCIQSRNVPFVTYGDCENIKPNSVSGAEKYL